MECIDDLLLKGVHTTHLEYFKYFLPRFEDLVLLDDVVVFPLIRAQMPLQILIIATPAVSIVEFFYCKISFN